MTSGPLDLLKLLASGTAGPDRAPVADRSAVTSADFRTLLDKAQAGEISSGVPVRIHRNAGVELTAEQLARLAEAADRAEAQGATRALVLIDGLALRLDVGMREITGATDLAGGKVLTGIDAVIDLNTRTPAKGAAPDVLPVPRHDAAMNPSLISILSDPRARRDAGAA